jgi:hypothetical protein
VRQHRPLDGIREVFVLLRAYMDDSGTHDGSDYCLIAGYWDSINEWGRFERAWNSVLADFGVLEFHGKTFWPRPNGKRLGEFKDWNDEHHHQFIDSLLTVIQTHKIYPFGFGVLTKEWAKVPIHLQRVYSGYHYAAAINDKRLKAIYLAVSSLFVHLSRYCRRGKSMHFFMDRDRRIASQVLECFSKLQSEARKDDIEQYSQMGSITFADSHESGPLQAADLLAYELQRYYKKWRGGEGDSKMRIEGIRAMTRMKTIQDFMLYDETRMANLNEVLEAAAVIDEKRRKSRV